MASQFLIPYLLNKVNEAEYEIHLENEVTHINKKNQPDKLFILKQITNINNLFYIDKEDYYFKLKENKEVFSFTYRRKKSNFTFLDTIIELLIFDYLDKEVLFFTHNKKIFVFHVKNIKENSYLVNIRKIDFIQLD